MKKPEECLPVGAYALADGREFVGLDDVEVKAFAAQGWRRQFVADDVLARRLAALPGRPDLVHPAPARSAPPRQLTLDDLFMPNASTEPALPKGARFDRSD